MFYLVKTPWWLKKLYSRYSWDIPVSDNSVFLTFDDGPHPQITPFVLDELKKYGAKASFFCIGKNVAAFPDIYARIIEEGHAVGNHTQNHFSGFKTDDEHYVADYLAAGKLIDSQLFRPPYGRIRRSQYRKMAEVTPGIKVIMWDVLSGDFDPGLSKEDCLQNVLKNSRPGSVIVFHDSEKAFEKMSFALPHVLEFFKERKYVLKQIDG